MYLPGTCAIHSSHMSWINVNDGDKYRAAFGECMYKYMTSCSYHHDILTFRDVEQPQFTPQFLADSITVGFKTPVGLMKFSSMKVDVL